VSADKLTSSVQMGIIEFHTFFVDYCLSIALMDNWVHKYFLDNWFLKDLSHNVLSFLDISQMSMLFLDNRKMFLFNEGGVFLMDNGLMMFMDVLLIDHRLMMLMNDVLMMLM